MYTLEQLGYEHYAGKMGSHKTAGLVARVSAEFGSRYAVLAVAGELEAVTNKTFITRLATAQRPKVGDWIVYEPISGEKKVRIISTLPRYSELARKRVGKRLEAQVLATNVDVVFIMESLTTNFDASRIERFLVVPENSNVRAVLVLSKVDAIAPTARNTYLTKTRERFPHLDIIITSIKTETGLAEVATRLPTGTTGVFIGPSGVGKSSLVNALLGSDKLYTGLAREGDDKGRHTTTRRELLLLPWGGTIIDTPGMRELQLWGSADTRLSTAFDDLELLSQKCKYTNCDHRKSARCALLAAIASGKLTKARYHSFLKLKDELRHHSAKIDYEAQLTKRKREKKTHQDVRTIARRGRGKRT